MGLSTDQFNWQEKQKKSYFTYEERKAMLEAIRYVDLVIPEENWDQKKPTWKIPCRYLCHRRRLERRPFDFLRDQCEVVYLSRTPEISTTKIKTELHT